VSVGIAGGRTTAKVASDRAKPDGLLQVPIGNDAAFLAPLPVRDLPLVGPKLAATLQAVGVHTIGQAAAADPAWLAQRFGAAGALLSERARGIDPARVRALPRLPVSVSREVTFGQDIADVAELRRVLRRHADRVGADLRQAGRRARTVTLKVRWPDFSVVTRSRTVERPAQSTAQLAGVGIELLGEVFASVGLRPVRLIGLGATNLIDDVVQLGFDDGGTLRDERLDRAVDAIRERFGQAALSRGRRAITTERYGEQT
jgi:DNA polymerase-4